MCGLNAIFGNYSNGFFANDLNSFNHSHLLNSFRGMDSTGVGFVFNDGTTKIIKSLGPAWNLLTTKEYGDLKDMAVKKGRFIIGHGRSATVGDRTVENAHPFRVQKRDDKGELTQDIILVHNGTLNEHLNKGMSSFKVDSEWMADRIAEVGPQEALETIHGAIATMWYDSIKKELYVYRNYQRPLFWAEDKAGSIFINSEASVLNYINERFALKFAEAPQPFKEMTLHTISLDPNDHPKDSYWTTSVFSHPVHKYEKTTYKNGIWSGEVISRIPETNRPKEPTHSTQDSRKNHFLGLCRAVLAGRMTEVSFDSGNQLIVWGMSAKMDGLPETSEYITATPVDDLIYIKNASAGSLKQVELGYREKGGNVIIVYRTLADLDALDSKPKASIPVLVDKVEKGPVLTKKNIRVLSEQYQINTVPKPEEMCRWNSNVIHNVGDKSTKMTIKNWALSERKNPFFFDVYGNSTDGYFYKNQSVIFNIDYSTPTPSGEIYRYVCSLIPKDSSASLIFEFYSKKILEGTVFTGIVSNIRCATRKEFQLEDVQIIIQLRDIEDVSHWKDIEIDGVSNSPRNIAGISTAIQLSKGEQRAS